MISYFYKIIDEILSNYLQKFAKNNEAIMNMHLWGLVENTPKLATFSNGYAKNERELKLDEN